MQQMCDEQADGLVGAQVRGGQTDVGLRAN